MTPKTSVRPLAINAYTPPVRTPRMQAWTTMCTSSLLAPGRLRCERRVQRDVLRVDGQQLAVHPFDEQVASLRLADRVPAQHALDRRPAAAVQRVDDLAVVERLRLRDRELQHLSRRIRLRRRRVDAARAAAVLLHVSVYERLVSG